ncbi:tyrosine-type recombinase/integrase [Mangrovicoccus ximenensis]|uniref:tyrosine-type recombinase/integrase n=1 Tax=Mangrovicoccus ximenensis TaxID=1911570 RepID=UPI000D348BF3|nr:tyrosine-type recombinase/integrase [Mangrovicoccus ximenensis]
MGSATTPISGFGKPFTSNGFGNRMRKWADAAGLKNCSTHGLRKAAAARLAEKGCTEKEIMAITGHRTSKEATRYTRAASQKTLADSAMAKLSRTAQGEESGPTPRTAKFER